MAFLVSLLAVGGSWKLNRSITVNWPCSVVRHEAIIGGTFAGLDQSDGISVYVCTDKQCWLQESSESPVKEKDETLSVAAWLAITFKPFSGQWHAFARFGNEKPDLNDRSSAVRFHVVAAAGDLDVHRREGCGPTVKCDDPELAMSACAAWNGDAYKLRDKLRASGLVVSEPKEIRREWEAGTRLRIASIASDGVWMERPGAEQGPFDVCPPVTVKFDIPGYVEVFYDAEACYAAKDTVHAAYEIRNWPKDVAKIEVKVSPTQRGGPYDSIYFRLRAHCPGGAR
jgi:hypothetical protein